MPLICVNGLDLNVERHGEGTPLLLLHGFTGSAASWHGVLPALARRRRVIAVDLVGHGASAKPAEVERYRMPAVAADLAALLDALALPTVDLLGYSMGGRTALHFALAYPRRVTALVLEGSSPGIPDAEERAARERADEALAARIEREGIAAFVREWEALPLFASQRRLPAATLAAQRAQRLANDPLGLANSLRGMGAGAQEPLWERLPALRAPTLLLAGAEDGKYRALAQAMADRMPAARAVEVPEAGHAAHLEQPAAFVAAVLAFLEDVEPGAPDGEEVARQPAPAAKGPDGPMESIAERSRA